MSSDPFIPADMWRRIDGELAAIARANGIRILLAVESGSRAWRFPSLDSDFDVRFLYLRPLSGYLSVAPFRDVIERPMDAVLDINGWDLRKALNLMLKSNATLLEWLDSPIRYHDTGAIPARLRDLARETCDLKALAYHYDHQARRGLSAVIAADGQPRMKDYCYALRPALALSWIRSHRTTPPMALPALLEGQDVPQDGRSAIVDLVARKSAATEGDGTARLPVLERFVATLLTETVARPRRTLRGEVLARANAFFAEVVQGQSDQSLSDPSVSTCS